MSLWIDEIFTLRNAGQPSVAAIVAAAAATERRPPLSFLVFHLWLGRFPNVEFAWRWLPAAFAVLAVAAGVRLAERVQRGSGPLAALLLAVSPYLLLYGAMVRAYSLTLLLGLLMTLFLVEERPLAYTVVAAAGLWTDYLLWFLVAAHALWLLGWKGSKMRAGERRAWFFVFLALGIAALPLIAPALGQRRQVLVAADLATTPLGIALKLGYTPYAYLLGETLFPWSPWAWLGLIGVAVALVGLRGPVTPARRLLILSAGLPVLAIIVLLSLLATDLPFVNVPSRAIVAAPIVLIALAAGLHRLPPRIGRLAVGAILVANSVALINLYTDTNYINPIYAVPAREVATTIRAQAMPDALVLAEQDTALPFYLTHQPGGPPVLAPGAVEAVMQLPPEVWLFSFGRDRTRVLEGEPRARAWLVANGYTLVAATAYVPTDPTYAAVKHRLLGREAYAAKATLEQWRRQNRRVAETRKPDAWCSERRTITI